MARKKHDEPSSASDVSPSEPDGSADVLQDLASPGDSPSRAPWYQISGWRLRNKIALSLAFPMIAASWFATDKAIESYLVQQSHEATAEQVRVLAPALDFLYAAENSYVQTLHTEVGSPERLAAVDEVTQTAQALAAVQGSDALDENQRSKINTLLAWSEQLQDPAARRVTTATTSQATQLHNAVQDYYQTIVAGQVVPEASLQQIAFVMDGHFGLTMQRIYTEPDSTKIRNQTELLQWIGIERGAIDSLVDARPAGDPDATSLTSQNVQRPPVVAQGNGELRYTPALDLYNSINRVAVDEALAALDENAAEARAKALLNMAILLGSLAVTMLLAWLIARLIVNPVRRVRDGALNVANDALPRAVAQIRAGEEPDAIIPIDVTTDEEMGQLARAVDDLHRAAVGLASGEARLRSQVGEMFVTLSRRNTSLINQQLGLIEELERDEQDPRRLESLFRLDHLAARMRRTAESLVILSDAPVRLRDAAPLSVTDSLQAATAGVQEYQRVELRGATTTQIVGAAANDVVHLLTELIDNALSFSPPTAPVQVSTTTDGSSVTIAISDGGLGMPADMLRQLNEMLAQQVGVTPDAARRMGLFVVSRLARRHDLGVSLSENGRGGVTATVVIPAALIVGATPTLTTPNAAPAAGLPAPVLNAPVNDAPVFDAPDALSAPVADEAAAVAPLASVDMFAPLADEAKASAPVQAEPFKAQPVRAPAARTAPDPLSDPLTDPLTDPLPPLPVADKAPAPSPFGGLLPKRRPGATVPDRTAAVNPMGDSLFGGGDKPSGGLFSRSENAPASPAPAADPLSDPIVEQVAEPAVEQVAEPAVEETAVPEAEIVPLVAWTPSTLTEDLTPATGHFNHEATPVAEEAAEQRGDEERVVEPETPATRASVSSLELPPLALRATHADVDEPVTPATTDNSVSMFGDVGADTRTLPVRDPQDNPVAAARMGMFNALAKGSARAERSSLTDTTASPQSAAAPAGDGTQGEEHDGEAPSSWLSGQGTGFVNSSADAGWAAAEQVAKHVETRRTEAGLPQRRPGQRLVPGAVAPTRTTPPRDPEAIRRRLASHAAGVSRGRTATVTPTTPAQEEGQS
ncbi:sensor histidine kinase [Nocardioides yefusunii]|uniref:histidine kinase n=1 Tax=Nocardioides yefusunii TaxID=2500546 RepID=A0ABW1R0N2_9ACTN|nr:sensor histidine kinase [Nocardioides yefusunii]